MRDFMKDLEYLKVDKKKKVMDKIKELGGKAIDWVKDWYITNWNGESFDRMKVIFVSFFILMFLLALFV